MELLKINTQNKMPEKTMQDLENELAMKEALDKEREVSDRRYAFKYVEKEISNIKEKLSNYSLVEKIVFTAMALIATGFLGFLISLAFKNK